MATRKTSTVSLQIEHLLDVAAPLYSQAFCDDELHRAYVVLTQHGIVTTFHFRSPDDDGYPYLPIEERNGIDLYFPVNPYVYGKALHAYLTTEGLPLIQRIHDNRYIVRKNGIAVSGRLEHGANIRIPELLYDLRSLRGAMIHLAENWALEYDELHRTWSDQPLSDAVSALETKAIELGNRRIPGHVEGDIKEALLKEAKRIFDDQINHQPTHDEPLDKFHIAALLEAGLITADQADQWASDELCCPVPAHQSIDDRS